MKLTFDISRQDYADFNKFHFLKTKLIRTIITGTITVIGLEIYLNHERFDLRSTLISSITCIVLYFFAIKWSLNNTKSIPVNEGTILGQKEMEFAEDRITYKTTNSEGSNDWKTIKKLEESSKAFYLYLDANVAILVPKRVFNGKSDEEAFKTLVKQKINIT